MSQCISKRRFASEEEASQALQTIRGSNEAYLLPKVPSRYYFCDICGGWHLTAVHNWSPDTKPARRRGKRR